MTQITTPESVLSLRPVTSYDWESIPSGIGSRLLPHLLSRSDLYGRSQKDLPEQDIVNLSSCGAFGGAIAFAIGGEAGRREWQSRWTNDRDAVAIALGLQAGKSNTIRFTDKDITASVMRDPEIARAMLVVHAYDGYHRNTPFSVLKCDDIKAMYAQDVGAVASVFVADGRQAANIISFLPDDSAEFWSNVTEIKNSPIDMIRMVGSHISPCSPVAMTIMDFLAPQFGSRWNPKADRILRTSELLDRETTEWRQTDSGWLRMALNHCTEHHPDRLVGWIGQAPCLYEFLNTAAKQRRGVIAARRLIRMVGR